MNDWIPMKDMKPRHGTKILAIIEVSEDCFDEMVILLVGKHGKKNTYFNELYDTSTKPERLLVIDVGRIKEEFIKAWMPLPEIIRGIDNV